MFAQSPCSFSMSYRYHISRILSCFLPTLPVTSYHLLAGSVPRLLYSRGIFGSYMIHNIWCCITVCHRYAHVGHLAYVSWPSVQGCSVFDRRISRRAKVRPELLFLQPRQDEGNTQKLQKIVKDGSKILRSWVISDYGKLPVCLTGLLTTKWDEHPAQLLPCSRNVSWKAKVHRDHNCKNVVTGFDGSDWSYPQYVYNGSW